MPRREGERGTGEAVYRTINPTPMSGPTWSARRKPTWPATRKVTPAATLIVSQAPIRGVIL
ncbi:MAG: hypothetical protein NTX53_03660 [candidate division WOR-3 bacterium]|nr:hypothetical protein [candidate division WOR-3 bacterium]